MPARNSHACLSSCLLSTSWTPSPPCASATGSSPTASCATPRPPSPRACVASAAPPSGRSPRSRTCVAVVGGLTAGVELVPLNPKLGTSELAHIIGDSQPEVVLGAPEGALDAADAPPPIAAVDIDAKGGPRCPPTKALDDDAPALVLYTSGTTGAPKGALMPRRAIAANLDALADAWEWTGEDTLVHALPLFHVHGLVLGLFGAAAPRRRPALARALRRREGSPRRSRRRRRCSSRVPTMYHRLAEAAERDPAVAAALRAARLLVSGSAPLPAPRARADRAATGQRVVERYGLTETLINMRRAAPTASAAPGYVGPAAPGRRAAARRRRARRRSPPATATTIGEVAVRGPNVFAGYLNRPDATAAAMRRRLVLHRRPGDASPPTATSASSAAARPTSSRPAASRSAPARSRRRCSSTRGCARPRSSAAPDDDLGERIVAFVVAERRRRRADPERPRRPRRRSCSRRTSARARSASSTSCRATRWARSSSSASEPRDRGRGAARRRAPREGRHGPADRAPGAPRRAVAGDPRGAARGVRVGRRRLPRRHRHGRDLLGRLRPRAGSATPSTPSARTRRSRRRPSRRSTRCTPAGCRSSRR